MHTFKSQSLGCYSVVGQNYKAASHRGDAHRSTLSALCLPWVNEPAQGRSINSPLFNLHQHHTYDLLADWSMFDRRPRPSAARDFFSPACFCIPLILADSERSRSKCANLRPASTQRSQFRSDSCTATLLVSAAVRYYLVCVRALPPSIFQQTSTGNSCLRRYVRTTIPLLP